MLSRALDTASAWLARLTGVLAVAMGGIAMVSLILQVFSRYVLSQTFIWTEELALFLFTWVVLLVGSLGIREGFHVRLTLLLDFLPEGARLWAERLILLLVLVFGVALAFSGAHYVDATLGQVSAAVRYPIETLHFAAPVAGVLVTVHALARLVNPPAIDPDPEPPYE